MLMIIDNEFMRKTLRQWLSEQFTKLTIIEAGSGEEALDILQSKSPELVLMDIFLPNMTGIETTKHIKILFPDTLVIFLTIHEDGIYQSLAADAGADACVLKHKLYTDLIPAILSVLRDDGGIYDDFS